MAIGPVQLIVLGFEHPEFHGEIIEELEKLRESDTVRVIDSLAVYKDADGEIEVRHLSNLTKEEAVELGSKVAALIGLGIEGEKGFEEGAEIGAEMAAEHGVNVFSDEDAWDVLASHRAPLGGAPPRRGRASRRLQGLRRVHQSARPRCDRAGDRRRGGGTARPGEDRGGRAVLIP